MLSAALILTLPEAVETFAKSSGTTADVQNSTSPKNATSSTSTPGDAAARKQAPGVGNFPIIVPSKFNSGAETNSVANKVGADNNSANGENADNATPPPTPPPGPQSQVSQLSGRTFSRRRIAPERVELTAIKVTDHV